MRKSYVKNVKPLEKTLVLTSLQHSPLVNLSFHTGLGSNRGHFTRSSNYISTPTHLEYSSNIRKLKHCDLTYLESCLDPIFCCRSREHRNNSTGAALHRCLLNTGAAAAMTLPSGRWCFTMVASSEMSGLGWRGNGGALVQNQSSFSKDCPR